jgi:hypothetical protein
MYWVLARGVCGYLSYPTVRNAAERENDPVILVIMAVTLYKRYKPVLALEPSCRVSTMLAVIRRDGAMYFLALMGAFVGSRRYDAARVLTFLEKRRISRCASHGTRLQR